MKKPSKPLFNSVDGNIVDTLKEISDHLPYTQRQTLEAALWLFFGATDEEALAPS